MKQGSLNDIFSIGNIKKIPLKTALISDNRLSIILDALSGNDFAFASKENETTAKPQLVITYKTSKDKIDISNNIRLYPNPAKNKINFTGDTTDKVIKVFTPVGQLIKEVFLNKGESSIDITNIPPGYYLVTILQSGKTNKILSTLKVIKL